jgi:murein DD-endopeptidase MepM/ murein hydrolase activator NlpD
VAGVPRGVRAGLAALLLVALAPLPAAGQDAGVGIADPAARAVAVEQELSRLATQFEEGSLQEARLVAELHVSQREQAALQAEVARLDASLSQNLAALTAAEAAVASTATAEVTARRAVADAIGRVSAARDEVRESALLSYVGQSDLDLSAQVLADASNGTDLAVGFAYARIVGDVQQARVEALRREEAARRVLEAQAEEAGDAADAARRTVRSQRLQLTRDRAAQEQARQRAAAEVVAQQHLVDEVRAAQAAFVARMAALEAESAAIGALLRAQLATTTIAPATTAAATPAAGGTGPASPTPLPPASQPATPAPPAAPPPAPPAAPPPAPPRPPATTASPAPAPSPTATTATTAPAASARPTGPVGNPPPVRTSLGHPLPGFPLVSGYGSRIHPLLGSRRMHEGIDIWAPAGTPIRAAADGVVVWAGPRGGYGTAVILAHGGGLGTVYAHQSSVAVSQGQRVSRGDTIGFVGQTGLAAGPHLHFEVRVNGVAYDPLHYLG